ncbi:BTB/POZ domain-containing protein At3g49900-like [Phragmites australis]|uniref:BTB/POZ domain-containing protein At3g49900-like n=1 Tax=Phragmites australis TaxID=29695 RepID=UPI002D797761|nr:BTB/POZ domain-containing protein At3g49900-like [Phragmites australis]
MRAERAKGREGEREEEEEAGSMEMGRGWQELGIVDTIYEGDHEEEEEEECFDSPTMSSSATSRSCSPPPPPALSSLPPVLRSAVQAWSRANGSRKPDVILRVQEHCLPLHRDVITSKSSYLRRQLSESSDVTIALPGGLAFDAFIDGLASCYGADVALSPASLAAAWVAASWLELGAEDYDRLARAAEDYFFQEVATNHGRAAEVMRSCTAFLGGEAAGPAAELLVRCLEVLAASGCGGVGGWLKDVAGLPVEEFLVAVEAMRTRFAHDHDLMYTVVDHYLENHKGKLTEEEKTRLCYNVNCTKLSQHLFMHLVQNPRLPLRFVVQAMLVEQLHSHHSILLHHHHTASPPPPPAILKSSLSGAFSGVVGATDAASMTLGDILQRDSVLRQSAHIRASMQATSIRIETLERELAGLRTRLRRSEQQQAEASAKIDRAPGKSASFRIPRNRLWDGEDLAPIAAAAGRTTVKDSNGRGFKSRLVHGFKNLFGRRPGTAGALSKCGEDVRNGGMGEKGIAADARELDIDADDVLCMEETWRPHRRNHSIV